MREAGDEPMGRAEGGIGGSEPRFPASLATQRVPRTEVGIATCAHPDHSAPCRSVLCLAAWWRPEYPWELEGLTLGRDPTQKFKKGEKKRHLPVISSFQIDEGEVRPSRATVLAQVCLLTLRPRQGN